MCERPEQCFALLWATSVRIRYFLRRYMPTNILLDLIRTRRGLKWGIPAMLLAAPYLLAASTCTNIVGDCGPGWLNILVLLFIWNALKFVWIGPVSFVLLVRVRIQEAAARRRARRQDEAATVWNTGPAGASGSGSGRERRRRAAMMSVKVVPSASRTSTLAGVVRSFVARSMICPNEDRRHGGAKRVGFQPFRVDGDGHGAILAHIEYDERDGDRDGSGSGVLMPRGGPQPPWIRPGQRHDAIHPPGDPCQMPN